MASKAAELVVQDILEEVGNGRIPNVYQIQRNRGYSHESARNYKAIKTITAKETMATAAEKMEQERNRVLEEMARRDISEERLETLNKALDTLTKNHQLLTGGNTENTGINITFDESFKRYTEGESEGESREKR